MKQKRTLRATYADLEKYEDWFAKGANELEQFEIDLAKFEASPYKLTRNINNSSKRRRPMRRHSET